MMLKRLSIKNFGRGSSNRSLDGVSVGSSHCGGSGRSLVAEGSSSSPNAMKRPSSARYRADVLVVGPNPALQKTIVFNSGWNVNEVNRASSVTTSVGGKGQQFAVAAQRFIEHRDKELIARSRSISSLSSGSSPRTSSPRVVLVQLLGGSSGATVEKMLQGEGLEPVTSQVSVLLDEPGETRTCTTLIDGRCPGEATELIDPSAKVSGDVAVAFREAIFRAIEKSRPRAIACCGTMPPGLADSLYADTLAKGIGALTFLDGYRDGVSTALERGVVDILKVNRAELRLIAQGGEGSAPADDARAVFKRFSGKRLKWLAMTSGGSTSYLFHFNCANGSMTTTAFQPPTLRSLADLLPGDADKNEFITNPIGAGDTVGSIMLCEISRGTSVPEAFRMGIAAGSLSCLAIEGASFDPKLLSRACECVVHTSYP